MTMSKETKAHQGFPRRYLYITKPDWVLMPEYMYSSGGDRAVY